jgi:hypothetical protein
VRQWCDAVAVKVWVIVVHDSVCVELVADELVKVLVAVVLVYMQL